MTLKNKQLVIIFRCDASTNIGSGHVRRCINLAKSFKKKEVRVIFVMREGEDDLISEVNKNFEIIKLKRLSTRFDFSMKSIINIPSDNFRWLGCSQKEDSKEFIKAINNYGLNNIDWIIADNYDIDIEWETIVSKKLRLLNNSSRTRFLIIDDLANRKHNADIIVDHNLITKKKIENYKKLLSENCIKLIGPDYALLGEEYKILRESISPRKNVNRILVYFGATDPDQMTYKTFLALQNLNYEKIKIDIVLSKKDEHFNDIKVISDKEKNLYLYEKVNSMASLIARADLAFGAGGISALERGCLGLPSIVIVTANNQYEGALELYNQGNIIYLGKSYLLEVLDIQKTVEMFIKGREIVKKPMFIDGNGCERVASIVLSNSI